MKLFSQYLLESQEEKKYIFKIKVAGTIPDNCEDVMETALQKFKVLKFAKGKTSPIQAKLLDFPELQNESMTVYEAELQYPTTSASLAAYIAEQTGVPSSRIRVRSEKEEAEAEINAENTEEKKYTPLLLKQLDKENNQALVGEKKVSSFLKDIAKASKDSGLTQYKGVNDEILAKKLPKETTK
jgi:hypothetical protein